MSGDACPRCGALDCCGPALLSAASSPARVLKTHAFQERDRLRSQHLAAHRALDKAGAPIAEPGRAPFTLAERIDRLREKGGAP